MLSRKFTIFIALTVLLVSLVPAGLVLAAKGEPGPPNGGETAGNNLSFPVIWAEETTLTLFGTQLQATLTTPYAIAENPCGEGAFAYAQKTQEDGNIWQAQNEPATDTVFVNEIDWGDSLESVDMKVGRPIRVELSLYKLLDTPMTGYNMVMLANPSSPDEVQGVCAYGTDPLVDNGAGIFTYDSYEATVYSPYSKVVIQKLTGEKEAIEADDLFWNGTQWVDNDLEDDIEIGAPISVMFSGELNVGGKVIYGLSQGGWKPTDVSDYRITFYLPLSGNTQLEGATIRVAVEEEETVTAAEEGSDIGGGLAYVDGANNLTYIDISVVGGGGGGKNK